MPIRALEDSPGPLPGVTMPPQVLPLTVRADYLPEWGVKHGLRELLQNYLDADDASDLTGAATCDHETNTITLSNPGASIDRSALLFGGTSKAGTDARGRFGEGLKLGALALTRKGCTVRLAHGAEVWTFLITTSEEYGGQVLAVRISEAEEEDPGVTVTITGKPARYEWENVRALFREFCDIGAVFSCGQGDVLLDPRWRGSLFVRGQLIQTRDDIRYGYDLKQAWTDRDRDVVGSFDVSWHAAQMLSLASEAGKIEAADILEALIEDGCDVHYAGGAFDGWSQETRDKAAAAFYDLHGADAIPVKASLPEGERAKLITFGYVPVVVPDRAEEVLTRAIPSAEKAIRDASQSVTSEPATWEPADLQWLHGVVADAGLTMTIEPVNFRAASTKATCDKQSVQVAAWILPDRGGALSAVIEVYRVATKGDVWPAVIRALLGVTK